MSSSVHAEVHESLAAIAAGRTAALEDAGLRAEAVSLLDPKTVALVRIATSIALDAPPAAYSRQVRDAIETGVTPRELLALLRAVTPEIGSARAIAAAPEIMLALGLRLPGSARATPLR